MLHSLRSDEELGPPDIEEEAWARLVSKHWYLDEAAKGMGFDISLSARAVDSRDQSSSETANFFSCPELGDSGSVQDWLDSYILWSSQQFRLLKLENTSSGMY